MADPKESLLTVQWTVILLLSIIVALDTVAVVALVRQIGLLHLRLAPVPALQGDGPEPGSDLQLGPAAQKVLERKSVDRLIVGFISPTCSLCAPLVPAFNTLARSLSSTEDVILLTDADEIRTREYAGSKRIAVPILSDPDAFKGNRIPGAPFVVVADGARKCLAAGGVNTLEQVELLLEEARERERLDESVSSSNGSHLATSTDVNIGAIHRTGRDDTSVGEA